MSTASVARDDGQWVDVELWIEEDVVPGGGLAEAPCPLVADLAPMMLLPGESVPYYALLDLAYKDEARLREKHRRVSVSSGVATSASAETRRGLVPDFKLEASPQVASGPSLRPSFLQRFSGSMPRATEVSQSDFDVLDRLKEQKKRIERELADAERRRNELERLQREDPFKAARFLEREEKKRQRTAPHDDGGDVSRPTSEKKPREKKRTSPSRRASTGNEDVVGFKANMSAAVMAALKPFLVANRIADKESLKFLCRKLCKSLVEKETERGNYGRWHAKMGPAAVKFVEAHMAKLAARGEVYRYVEGEAHAPRAAPHSTAAPGVASGAPPPQLQPPQLYDPFAM